MQKQKRGQGQGRRGGVAVSGGVSVCGCSGCCSKLLDGCGRDRPAFVVEGSRAMTQSHKTWGAPRSGGPAAGDRPLSQGLLHPLEFNPTPVNQATSLQQIPPTVHLPYLQPQLSRPSSDNNSPSQVSTLAIRHPFLSPDCWRGRARHASDTVAKIKKGDPPNHHPPTTRPRNTHNQ